MATASPLIPEVAELRALLAAIAKNGIVLPASTHLAVLDAYHDLEHARPVGWPPPEQVEVTDLGEALEQATTLALAVLEDPIAHQLDPIRAGLAARHLQSARGAMA